LDAAQDFITDHIGVAQFDDQSALCSKCFFR
jgi:hypothetical protein